MSADYRLRLVYGDLDDGSSLTGRCAPVKPDEIYNLGAQSHVRVSFDVPEYTASTVALGTLRLLEAIRESGLDKSVRFYQASSSEMFGGAAAPAERDDAVRAAQPLRVRQGVRPPALPELPRSLRDVHLLRHPVQPRVAAPRDPVRHPQDHPGRRAHPARPGQEALPRQPRRQARLGLCRRLRRGDVDDAAAGRSPTITSIATGESHSVREVLDVAFGALDLDWHKYVEIDPRYFRPTEVDHLHGDPGKAQRVLGWKPQGQLQGADRDDGARRRGRRPAGAVGPRADVVTDERRGPHRPGAGGRRPRRAARCATSCGAPAGAVVARAARGL